ncbi:hypothetical protein LCGC14_2106810 [marine sediment metagenome]|uniref:Uncharacterized protein n=1 Tax=marine sediment metagenome TaxID=412755 RepID=A0A0F9GLI0_9ZZZZ
MPTKKKSGGARKYGRSKPACEKYRQMNTRERNKSRKLAKHPQEMATRQLCQKSVTKINKGIPAI